MGNLFDVTPTESKARASLAQGRWKVTFPSALVSDSLSYFGSKVVPGFMGLVSVPVFNRLIGMEQYGRFAVVTSFLMAVAGASSGWIAQGLLRFHPLATDSRQRQDVFDRAVRRCTVTSVLITSATLAMVLAGLRYSIGTVLISLSFCSSLLAYTVLLARFQAKLQPTSVLWREIVRSIGCLVLPVVIVLLTRWRRFELIILGQAIAYTVALLPGFQQRRSIVEVTASGRQDDLSRTLFSDDIIRQLWCFGWAVAAWLLLSQLFPVIDRWVIQKFASYSSAGVYASLYEVAVRSFSFLVFPFTQAAHPRIMRCWNEGRFSESYRIIRYSIVSQLAIFLVVLGGVYLFCDQITKLILGFEDPTAARMLPMLIIGGFLWQFALLLHKPMEIAQRTPAMLASMAVVMAVNVVACFLLVPRFGYSVAAGVLVFSASLYIVLTLVLTRFSVFRGSFPTPNAR
jgi:O-antigen/teichoic acid export membrane protein